MLSKVSVVVMLNKNLGEFPPDTFDRTRQRVALRSAGRKTLGIGGLRALGPPRQNLGPMNNLLDPLFAVESDFLIHFGVRLLFFVV